MILGIFVVLAIKRNMPGPAGGLRLEVHGRAVQHFRGGDIDPIQPQGRIQ